MMPKNISLIDINLRLWNITNNFPSLSSRPGAFQHETSYGPISLRYGEFLFASLTGVNQFTKNQHHLALFSPLWRVNVCLSRWRSKPVLQKSTSFGPVFSPLWRVHVRLSRWSKPVLKNQHHLALFSSLWRVNVRLSRWGEPVLKKIKFQWSEPLLNHLIRLYSLF